VPVRVIETAAAEDIGLAGLCTRAHNSIIVGRVAGCRAREI